MSHSQSWTGDNLSLMDFALPAAPHSVNCCGLTQKEGWWETRIAIDYVSALKRKQIFRTLTEEHSLKGHIGQL